MICVWRVEHKKHNYHLTHKKNPTKSQSVQSALGSICTARTHNNTKITTTITKKNGADNDIDGVRNIFVVVIVCDIRSDFAFW